MRNTLSLILIFVSAFAFSQSESPLKRIQVAEAGVVALNNSRSLLPLKSLKDLEIASVDLGFSNSAVFDSIAGKYWALKTFRGDTITTVEGFNGLHMKLKFFNLIFLKLPDQASASKALIDFAADLERQTKVVFVVARDGANLAKLNKMKSPVIWHKLNSPEAASVSAQVIFGGMASNTKLDADYSEVFKKGSGFNIQKTRLGYSIPESVSLSSDFTSGIDALVKDGIAAHSAPSAVILVAKDGKVIFNKAYGTHVYNGVVPTRLDDIYDMASVTKVTATTPSVMRLYEQKMIGLDSPISIYVATTRNIPDKKDVKIKEALLHEGGFYPYIKFFELLKPGEMSKDSSAAYPIKVADGYFLRANYFEEVMWPVTLRSHGGTRGKFVYSDVGMYMLKEVVEQTTRRRLDEYVLNEFYLPLGMQATGFRPRNRFEKARIVPTTENDNWFRDMLVQGYVNDPGAAMSGGVQGHAGLFSNANDLAIYYQMLLNKGSYGGDSYFESSTVDLFTSRQSKVSPRGYGFARLTEAEENADRGFPSQLAYGHSGYTGTYVWVDPKYNMIYICLTNRVYPDDNKTYGVSKINLRARVLDYVYEEIIKAKKQ
ncbi:MAG: serine hydrolase domain-containing protein [Daejeonella sp.]|uniref:serine hydrolase domain-containing protein n=1 Tax=Daejeonella sp. JGW-45 TaxID=3034148 RepID=UPI0023EC3419|nr:serine hydrolase [Daejeonella sp. JGW-45]